jgi:hypothetical protein
MHRLEGSDAGRSAQGQWCEVAVDGACSDSSLHTTIQQLYDQGGSATGRCHRYEQVELGNRAMAGAEQ